MDHPTLAMCGRIAIAGYAILVTTKAIAADFGGGCCADLEARIAELEDTAARKGNRKVSLTVTGHVNEAVLFWDDGAESDAYVVTNDTSRTKFRFEGVGKITTDWSAGYLIEIGVRTANSARVNQDDDDVGNGLDLRHAAWWLQSQTWGRVWIGQTSSATDGITELNATNGWLIGSNDINYWNGGFFLRPSGSAELSAVPWAAINSVWNANVGEGDRRNLAEYVSPTWHGLTFSTAWGEASFWDAALRYSTEARGFKVTLGIGYQWYGDREANCANLGGSAIDCNALGMSGTLMHVPTGLYVFGAHGFADDHNRSELFGYPVKERDQHWYLQAGIEHPWFAIGKTTLYGEYFRGETGAGVCGAVTTIGDGESCTAGSVRPVLSDDPLNLSGSDARIGSSDVDVWGFGLVQAIDAAAMHLYIGYRNYSADVGLTDNSGNPVPSRSIDDFQAVFAGGIIRF
jgi:hypothetical protein